MSEVLQKRPIGNMSEVLFKKLMDEIRGYYFCKILFCGLGEPAMHPDISKYFDYLKSLKKHAVSVVTNGLFLERFEPEKILDWNIDALTVSVDGYDSDTYLQHRPGGNYHNLRENVQNLFQARSKRRQKYPRIRISQILFPDEMNHSRINNVREDWIRFSDAVNFTSLMPFEKKTYGALKQCSHTIFNINIRWDGRIPICAFNSMEFVGDTNYSSIKEIFNGKEKRYLQECQRHKDFEKIKYCKSCMVCQEKERIASLHGLNRYKSKMLTATNVVYRKLKLGLR